MTTTTIYGSADIATELGVSRNVVSNWLARHDDTPAPTYVTDDGRMFWTAEGIDAWHLWQEGRKK